LKLTLGQIADFIHAEGDFTTKTEVQGYSIDSRPVSSGELYFAVRGERLDGHDFVEAALANGAAAAVVSMRWLAPADVDSCKLLRVPDVDTGGVLLSLQKLAHAVRRTWGGRVIGITGSAGKTTTKEAVAAVLATSFRVLKSQGNLNNEFGLPLQLLKLEPDHQVAVIEMGMNHAGEIAALARIAEPDWAVVSNVSAAHLEYFPEGIAGIAAAKYELIQALPEDGIAVLNSDDPYVASFARGLGERAILFGMEQPAAVRAVLVTEVGAEGVVFTVEARGERASVQLRLLGRHNVYNALGAITVGLQSGISLATCCKAVGEMTAGDRRGEILIWRDATLINDCYNSNPAALDSMVDALLAMPVQRHIVIAGEMLELGPDGGELHAACGRRMAERGVDLVIGVRGAAALLVEAAHKGGVDALFCETPEDAGAWMQANVQAGDAVLLKGSRGVRLERALTLLTTESQ
jgi:UDP-N-acetylmuramoyl-tripeptide--D-alanyl-D-alanine ligase